MRCPWCKHDMGESTYHFNLSTKRRKVFEVILASGPMGMDATKLIDKFFDDGTEYRVGGYTTLRTTIYNINRAIKPLKIVAKAGNYRVETHT